MVYRLQFGQQATMALHEHPDIRVGVSINRGVPLTSPVESVVQALQNPLGFPSLHLAATPGDRVVIALDREISDPTPIVAGIMKVLESGGGESSDVLVLLGSTDSRGAEGPTSGRPAGEAARITPLQRLPSSVRVEFHDPKDRGQLAYLAASQEGNPIYFNRHLVDADLVVPVSPMRPAESPGYLGVFGGLLPKFSDEETEFRFRDVAVQNGRHSQNTLARECDEAAWLLGTMLAVQVATGADGRLQGVVAGVPETLAAHIQDEWFEKLSYQPPFRAGFVVATLAGGASQQTWANVSRALHTAAKVADPSSDIVLCTELQSLPIPAPSTHSSFPQVTKSKNSDWESDIPPFAGFSKSDPFAPTPSPESFDFLPAGSRVFLLSGLPEDAVEELGWGYLQHSDEIQRLADQHQSWILLEDAHHLRIADDQKELS